MTPHKKTIKEESFYLYGYELPTTTTTHRKLIQVRRHLRIQKEESAEKKTA
jgi:hypothetical protein